MLLGRQDLLYTFRSARRAPFMTLLVVLTLTVGIGLNVGVFALLNYLFLQAPTKKDPARFVQLYPRYEGWFAGANQSISLTLDDYKAIREQSHALEDAAAFQGPMGGVVNDMHKRTPAALVTCNYFQVYGFDHPLMGRFLLPEECKPGTAADVVVLSERYWKSTFGADKAILGKVIRVNQMHLTVVGIAPDASENFIPIDLWMPFTLQPQWNPSNNLLSKRDTPWLMVVGRLREGYSRTHAAAELTTILRRQDRLYPPQNATSGSRKTSVILTNGSLLANPSLRSLRLGLMVIILGPLSLVLLLACTNVTVLFLSRSIKRRGEVAVRLALGVSKGRLARMLVTESFCTAAIAGVLSTVLAWKIPGWILNFAESAEGKFGSLVTPDWHVFAYLAVLVVIATLACSLAPMRAAFRLDLLTALKGHEGSVTTRMRTTTAIVIAQVAMSFVLLTAAVVFSRLPGMVTGMDPGFETRHVMSVPLEVNTTLNTPSASLTFYRSVESRIRELPGVQSVAYASLEPFHQPNFSEIRLANQSEGQGQPASINDVSPDFFSTFGIALLRGRAFLDSDSSATSTAPVAVVSEALAKAFWGNGNPLGNTIITPDNRRLVVVGVVRDLRSERFGVLDGPRLYTLRDAQTLDGPLYVRFNGDAASLAAGIESAIHSIDPNQVGIPDTIWNNLKAEAEAMDSLATIVRFMAAIAVVLVITGLYAVLMFATNQRRRELGIQMVLGATRPSIFRAILFKGLMQTAIGFVCGLALIAPGAWLWARLLRKSSLPPMSFDPMVYGIATSILLLVALAAMYLPALRATQVDPIEVLRQE